MRRIAPPLVLSALFLAASAAQAGSDSWNSIKDMAKQQANQKAEESLGLPQAAPQGAKVYFIEPRDGAELSGPVKVVFGLAGMGVAPAGVNQTSTGHHHLLIDDPAVDLTKPLPSSEQVKHFGGGQTETTLDLKPGKHTLQLVLGDWKHQPHNPTVASGKITVTVKK